MCSAIIGVLSSGTGNISILHAPNVNVVPASTSIKLCLKSFHFPSAFGPTLTKFSGLLNWCLKKINKTSVRTFFQTNHVSPNRKHHIIPNVVQRYHVCPHYKHQVICHVFLRLHVSPNRKHHIIHARPKGEHHKIQTDFNDIMLTRIANTIQL